MRSLRALLDASTKLSRVRHLVAALLALGCSPADSAARRPDDASAGRRDAFGNPFCPVDAPTHGSSCETPDVRCQYGSEVDYACRATFTCTHEVDGDVWRGSRGPCRIGVCSASPDDGVQCALPGLVCAHASGSRSTLCRCEDCHGLGHDAGACASPTSFVCRTGSVDCPASAPNVGGQCSLGARCEYGFEGTTIRFACREHGWEPEL